mgnify:CR=1 FL=1
MKKNYLFLIVGIVIGILLTLGITKLELFSGINPDKKKEAIIYAQKLIHNEFNKENKRSYYEGENPFYEGITFPPISKIKIEKTEFGTYVITFYANYHSERCVSYLVKEINSCYPTSGDSFYVELDYSDGEWNKIESRRINPYK